MSNDENPPPVSRPRTTTGQLRVVELMTHITSDAVWKRPRLTIDKRGGPRFGVRESLTVIGAGDQSGVAVAFFQDGELWALKLPDEGFDDDDGVDEIIDGQVYGRLGEAKPRWAERVLYAQHLQDREDDALLASIPTLT